MQVRATGRTQSDPSMTYQPRVLFVDAYDSFSANIVALLRRLLCADIVTLKIDACLESIGPDAETLQSFLQEFDATVLGPGPGNPINPPDIGLFPLVWKHAAHTQIPVLGICLGFQSLCNEFGLAISRLDLPCHGHAKAIQHCNDDVFQDIGGIIATCYNSLGVRMTVPNSTPDISRPASSDSSKSYASTSSLDSVPDGTIAKTRRGAEYHERPDLPFRVLAYDGYGYVMAIRHQSFPFWGFQFHPESCKSNTACDELLRSWWAKVQMHNSKHRSANLRQIEAVSQNQSPLNAAQMTNSISSSPTADLLRSLTRDINETARFETLPLTCDRQQLADLCYSLSARGSVAMLESANRGRFSIFAFPHESTWHLTFRNGRLSISRDQEKIQQQVMPLRNAMRLVEDLLTGILFTEGAPEIPFWGGFIGFYSYEAGLDLLEVSTTDDWSSRDVPEISLMWVDRSIMVDHQKKTVIVQTIRRDDNAWLEQTLAETKALFRERTSKQGIDSFGIQLIVPTQTPFPSHDQYISKIRSCQSSLYAGDSYELCLTTSASLTSDIPPYALYSSLQQTNPAPYAAYLDLLDTHVISSSPEQFLSWSRDDPYLDMMPMKGTLSKSPTTNTIQKAREVLLNPKEEAENLMIADLIRHDLHTALGPNGHVTVEKLFEVVETESLYQLVSYIRGHIPIPALTTEKEQRLHIMKAGHRALTTALPPGSMTGAPKKRSCEILRSLERRNRGVYSGVIGFFDVGGGGEWSVGIRCAFSQDGENIYETEDVGGVEHGPGKGQKKGDEGERKRRRWHVGAGGAITVLSDEDAEWDEMRAKMDSVLSGFGVKR